MRRKLLSMVLVTILTLSMTVGVFAEEPVQTAAEVSVPSLWAYESVQEANLYYIGGPSNYNGFQNPTLVMDLAYVIGSLNNKFETSVRVERTDVPITRGQALEALYSVIYQGLALGDDVEPVAYFVENGLMKGREDGEYALNQTITKEELLVFAKRVFEHISDASGRDSKAYAWEVTDGDNTVYLLGSVHYNDGAIFPLSEPIREAFDESEALCVEVNILNTQDITSYVMEIMFLEGEQTIDQLISEEVYTQYETAMTEIGVLPDVYNKLKPWYGALLLQSAQIQKSTSENQGGGAGTGVDMFYLAKSYGFKPILEVEGAKFQLDMFDTFSPEIQEMYLEATLESGENEEAIEDALSGIFEAYKTGDIEKLKEYIFIDENASELEQEFNAHVFEYRNNHMAEYVINLLAQDVENDYFVVVGAGHMIGESGIVAQLEAAGYEVNRIMD